MMVATKANVFAMLAWQWKYILFFTTTAVAGAIVHFEIWRDAALPVLPFGIVGGALGIFVSFRTNQAYARWWEARQLWGRMINNSRTLASQVLTYMPPDGDGRAIAEGIVRRQVAYVHVLRVQLRNQDVAKDSEVERLLGVVCQTKFAGDANAAYLLAYENHEALAAAVRAKHVTDTQMLAIDETLRQILDVQGGCERIKRTPMPQGYAMIMSRLLAAFALALPFALVRDLGWGMIPVSVFVCLAFALISESGRILEDPFNMYWNGMPLMALTRTIELNLRQRLGDAEIPGIPGPDKRGVLM
jgi:ion channel-forming bestrophin family protein